MYVFLHPSSTSVREPSVSVLDLLSDVLHTDGRQELGEGRGKFLVEQDILQHHRGGMRPELSPKTSETDLWTDVGCTRTPGPGGCLLIAS